MKVDERKYEQKEMGSEIYLCLTERRSGADNQSVPIFMVAEGY